MSHRKQTKGRCALCGLEIGKGHVIKHLDTCAEQQKTIEGAENGRGASETLYHLRVQDAHGGDFWLDLEIRGNASLKTLDTYLRAIWLECCGHLSEFNSGGWGSSKIAMSRKAQDVFEPGVEITHIYDFGTSSETRIKVMGMRKGKPMTKHPVALLVRNVMPEVACQECEQKATHLCMECMIENDESGLLCDEHTQTHSHDDYGEPVALINSPRLGMCGYVGPAEPPY